MRKIAAIVLSISMLLSMTAAVGAAEEAETEADGFKNGYPIVEIESELAVQENFTRTVENTASKHPAEEYQDYILFYGASNFARWTKMPKDMAEYKVINHAFGGSTDVDLVHFANDALFPYQSPIVFFQTGSNDYVNQEGTDEEKIEKCMNFKYQMFSAFHEIMPDSNFVIMSGLLLPGRAEYLEMTQVINEKLKELADENDYIYFVDASDMTWDGTAFAEELFNDDGIHLNADGQHAWYEGYIKPAIETVIADKGLDCVRKEVEAEEAPAEDAAAVADEAGAEVPAEDAAEGAAVENAAAEGAAAPSEEGAEDPAEDTAADDAAAEGTYTQMKVFDGTYGFGDAEITVYTNDAQDRFYIYFYSFDSDQILEGTVTDGMCNVEYDLSGFMAGDCQLMWDDAMASEAPWQPVEEQPASVGTEDAAEAPAEEAAEDANEAGTEVPAEAEAADEAGAEVPTEAEAADEAGAEVPAEAEAAAEDTAEAESRNGYPVINIDTNIKLKTIYEADVETLMQEHPYDENQNAVLFYGASNFARWTTMTDDLADYRVVNNAFGGSSDVELVHYANELLFPYNPSIVFFQTGSNEYGSLKGNYDERAEASLNYKKQMFEAFHEIMPDAKFVVMSGLLLPGRAHFLELTQKINEGLKALAEETDYIYFVDASDLTYDGETLKEELFVEDGLHLTEEGQQLWLEGYIRPALEQVITENGLDIVRK